MRFTQAERDKWREEPGFTMADVVRLLDECDALEKERDQAREGRSDVIRMYVRLCSRSADLATKLDALMLVAQRFEAQLEEALEQRRDAVERAVDLEGVAEDAISRARLPSGCRRCDEPKRGAE